MSLTTSQEWTIRVLLSIIFPFPFLFLTIIILLKEVYLFINEIRISNPANVNYNRATNSPAVATLQSLQPVVNVVHQYAINGSPVTADFYQRTVNRYQSVMNSLHPQPANAVNTAQPTAIILQPKANIVQPTLNASQSSVNSQQLTATTLHTMNALQHPAATSQSKKRLLKDKVQMWLRNCRRAETRSERLAAGQTIVLYHQTSVARALSIQESGIMLTGRSGSAGPGIYFATSKTATDGRARHHGAYITASVKLGTVKYLGIGERVSSRYTLAQLNSEGFDSFHMGTFTTSSVSGCYEYYDVYVVYSSDQVEVVNVEIIGYQTR